MSYPQIQKVPASRQSVLPTARGVDGHELDALRGIPRDPGSEQRMVAAVRTESADPYADPPCTD